tara:strand:- start:15039 stop:16484 length:1446 start_codon:yes stop_codon:yes gene_type:complete
MAEVSAPSLDYKDMQARFVLPDALMGGTLEMRKQGTTYMPQYPAEETTRYNRRLNNAVLYDAYRKAIDNLSARPFRTPVTIDDDAGDWWDEFVGDVDLANTALTTFARRQLADMLIYGKSHILVDYPDTASIAEERGRPLTAADEVWMNIRPYFVNISPKALIGWKSERIGGVETLTEIRILEETTEYVKGENWEEETIERVHRWTREEVTTFRKDSAESDAWREEYSRSNTLGLIPLVTIYANRQGFLKAWPPLEGLANLNQKHWWMQSDQDGIETVARVPMLFFRGFDSEDLAAIDIGPYKVFGNRANESDIKVVETSGKAVEVGRFALNNLEKQMQSMSMEPLIRKPGSVTATETALEEARNISDLESFVLLLETGIREGLGYVALWRNEDPLGVPLVNINKDSGLGLSDARELEELRLDYALGVIDQRTYLEHRKARGLYSEDMNIEEVVSDTQIEEGAEIDVTSFGPGSPAASNSQ